MVLTTVECRAPLWIGGKWQFVFRETLECVQCAASVKIARSAQPTSHDRYFSVLSDHAVFSQYPPMMTGDRSIGASPVET